MSDKRVLSKEKLEKELSHFMSKAEKIYGRKVAAEIIRAMKWARELHSEQKRASGEPYIIHPIRTAEIVMDIKMDAVSVIAALLHDVLEDTDITMEDLAAEFGEEVAMLVDGVTKISLDHVKNKDMQKTETIRKMFLAMVKDIRVIFIKLADKRHNMNTLNYMSVDKQKRISQECLEIFAPLAGKLGMNTLKSELEDLSLKYLHPETYKRIKEFVAHKKDARSEYLKRVKSGISRLAHENRIKIDVRTRAKHFYSIYRKMKDKSKNLDEIYDILGVRILCQTTTDCYAVLGLVHQLWPPLEGRFKDYIAMPKENNYQSLHTTVLCYDARPLEVQIRTFLMDEIAEYGVAAHLIYKENKPSSQMQSSWQLVDKLKLLHEQGYNSTDFLESLKRDILEDSIVVYTPNGDPKLLPKGSTAIDFAYHIHTEIGNTCNGAKANGMIIPLTRPLKNTETVRIITSKTAHPHVKWLKYVKTTTARSKIRSWLNKHDSSVIIDRNVVAIKKPETPPAPSAEKPAQGRHPAEELGTMLDRSRVGVTINNERNMMIRLARCCNPVPGDRIIGFVSRGRGIIVHKDTCPNLKGIEEFEERKIQVDWETSSGKFNRSFQIRSKYISDLFSQIEGAIRKHGGHLISGSLNETERGDLDGLFTVETEREDDFKKITRSIRMIPTVQQISRVRGVMDSDYE